MNGNTTNKNTKGERKGMTNKQLRLLFESLKRNVLALIQDEATKAKIESLFEELKKELE